MKTLVRLIARQVLGTVFLALLLLVALDALFDVVAELDIVGRGQYGMTQVMQYTLLTMPNRVQLMLPMAALLGSLMGLGMLASHNELTAMRAAGVSVSRIAGAVLYVGLALVALAILIGEYVAPQTYQLAKTLRASALTQGVVMSKDRSFWARDGASFINIRHLEPTGVLRDVYIYDFDAQQRLQLATHAADARHTGGGWVLRDVQRSRFSEAGVQVERLDEVAWQTQLTPDVLNVVMVKPEELSLRDLQRYIGYLRGNQLDTERYELAFWSNLSAPLTTLVMLMVGVPFVFGPLRSVSAGLRMVVGILAGVGFYLINKTTAQFAQVYDLDPLVSAFAPTLLFGIVALWALRRAG